MRRNAVNLMKQGIDQPTCLTGCKLSRCPRSGCTEAWRVRRHQARVTTIRYRSGHRSHEERWPSRALLSYLKGRDGDAANAIRTAVDYNSRGLQRVAARSPDGQRRPKTTASEVLRHTPPSFQPPKPFEIGKLARGDSLTIAFKAEKDGKVRLTPNSLAEAKVLLEGERLLGPPRSPTVDY